MLRSSHVALSIRRSQVLYSGCYFW